MSHIENKNIVNCYITKLDRKSPKFSIDETDRIGGWFNGFSFPNFCQGTSIEIVNGVLCYSGFSSDEMWHGLLIAINEKDGVFYQIHACSYGRDKHDAAKRTNDLWHLAWGKINNE